MEDIHIKNAAFVLWEKNKKIECEDLGIGLRKQLKEISRQNQELVWEVDPDYEILSCTKTIEKLIDEISSKKNDKLCTYASHYSLGNSLT